MLSRAAAAALAPSRRGFLKSVALGGGLALAIELPARAAGPAAPPPVPADPAAFLRITPDNRVIVQVKHLEMGQGVTTGLPAIVAEELDADWAQIGAEYAPADVKPYANLLFGIQGTGGSTAIANSWLQLRRAGAAARAMLIAAAAERWSVPAGDIVVVKGVVGHPASGRSATFGELADAAARQPVPPEPKLKDPKDFTLIGTDLPRRLDSPAKSTGTAQFTLDVTRPGMLVAVVRRAPKFGGKVRGFDAAAARAVPGVVDIVQVPSGVAVLARDTWSALRGREALSVDWDLSAAETRSSSRILADYARLADTAGRPAAMRGDADAALTAAAQRIEARFDFPFLAHAPMEPADAVLELKDGRAELWAGSQLQTLDHLAVARVLGLAPENVRINTLLAGGSFGRRANARSDFIVEAAEIVKAIGGRAPVKLMWTREDDIQGGLYRPAYHHKVEAGLDAGGRLVAWRHRIVGQSILAGTPFEAFLVKDGIDATSVEGAADTPYQIPNLRVELHTTASAVPPLWWRSVGHTHTAFVVETMIDRLARAAGQDPVAFRRALLSADARERGVLDLVAAKAGWGTPLPAGTARGIAVHQSFNTFVAQVAEVSIRDGAPKVERVVCAVDCGFAVTPDQVRAQMEGGIGFGLSAVLHSKLTLTDGAPDQSNFHDYEVLRIDEMPKVEVHILNSGAHPTGVGEPGVPPIGPAVANALAALTGKTYASLPIEQA